VNEGWKRGGLSEGSWQQGTECGEVEKAGSHDE
jgi:hypothetical protein